MPASDFVQGGHGSIVSMGDFVFEQDTCGFTHEGGTGSRIGRVITQFLDVSSYGAPRRRVLPVEEESTQRVVD